MPVNAPFPYHHPMSDSSVTRAVMTAGLLLLVGAASAGCSAVARPGESAGAVATSAPTPHAASPTSGMPSPRPTPSTTPTVTSPQPRRIPEGGAEYDAAIAAWPESLPPGYTWPAWTDLPHIDWTGRGQLGRADNASGVYRCILIDAAWHAYFEANDPVASKDYAARADHYVMPDNPSIVPVMQDGVIVDEELARANGICRGISGELSH